MKIDMVLNAALDAVAEQARQLHAMGFDGVYTQEANSDVTFPLLLAAQAAPVDIYTNVAIAFPRSPMHIAYAAFDLQRVSNGRFALGIGSQIRPHIEKRFSARFGNPVAHTAELVQALHAIFRCFHEGERLEFRGEYYTHTLMTPTFIPAALGCEPPPIWVGALGPRMTQMAAEVADGVLIHPFNSEQFLRTVTVPRIEAGLAASGRDRANFTLGVDVMACVYGNEAERVVAENGCRSNLAFYASTPSYRVTLDAHGWGDLQPELNRMTKIGRWADMPQLIDDALLDTLCIRGTPAEAGRALRQRYAGIADRVSLSVPYRIAPTTLAALVAAFGEK
ncbi:MAG: TIGR03617 family F420-dependent LLM class oxidoreductase [Acidimicrobiales bacterium]